MTLPDAALDTAAARLLTDLLNTAHNRLRARTLDLLRQARADLGVRSVAVTLPDGTPVAALTLPDPRPGIDIDDAALLAHVAAHHPTEIIRQVNPAFATALRRRLRIDGDTVIDTTTGEAVPWARPRPAAPPTGFTLTWTEGGRDALARECVRRLPALLAPALDGPDTQEATS